MLFFIIKTGDTIRVETTGLSPLEKIMGMYNYKYQIVIMHLDGVLKDLKIEDKTTIPFEVGKIYKNCVTKCRYRILECKEI